MKRQKILIYILLVCALTIGITSRDANTIYAQQTTGQNENEKLARRLVAAIQAGDDDAGTFYNAACAFALAGKTEEAFRYLEQAIARGFTNVEHIKQDSDLNSLHSDPRWQKMIERAESKRKEQQSAFWNQKAFWDNPALNTPYKENLSEEEKVAGLSKFWSEVKYNFVNFDLVPDLNWDAVYLSYLPRVRQTKSTLEYYFLLREMCAKLRDGHTNVYFPEALRDEALSRPPITTRLIEDKVLVTNVYDDALKQSGIERGQEVLEVDGIPVKQYAEQRVAPYQSVSTRQDLEVRMYDYALLSGSINNAVELTLRDKQGNTFKKSIPRMKGAELGKRFPQTQPFAFKLLPGNVAYVALNSFGDNRAAEMFEEKFDEIAKTDALIIDLRENGGGNSGVGYSVIGHLTDKPFKTSRWYTRQYRPTFRAWGRAQDTFGKEAGEASPNGKKLYVKPVIVLTSPRTFSAAEDFAVAFSFMKRGLIIGEPTGGSTGQPLGFSLPGGGGARVCTKRDTFPDGRDFVGVGVQPDKAVKPTVTDFHAGRDTVLEAALVEIKQRR